MFLNAIPEAHSSMAANAKKPAFLLIPPFPKRRVGQFTLVPDSATAIAFPKVVALLREQRVGGAYWARQPELPERYVLVRSVVGLSQVEGIAQGDPLLWLDDPFAKTLNAPANVQIMTGECDPWHMLGGASALVCRHDDPLHLIAAILGVATYFTDAGGERPWRSDSDPERLLAAEIGNAVLYASPFGGRPMNLAEVIELSGFWRKLIDSNRDLTGAVGFAFWKQASVLPLLWGGGDSRNFFRADDQAHKGSVAIWRAKTPPGLITKLEQRDAALVEVEDGFLRSSGLGADCVPPLSITVDRLGAYFDPGQPSELENLLQDGVFDAPLIERAKRLRASIVASGLGKYQRGGGATVSRFHSSRRHLLVTGQVEDDRSILTGGGGLVSNFELLRRVRERAPDAFIIYKPHPDVVAGHRKGHIDEVACRQIADKVVSQGSISALITMVDEVHVNTSLAGFEALMRYKDVTTYGIPFYAGWGLTHDLGAVPARRTARRTLDELVAATLLLYPRYLDPVSGLPAPPEVVVDRLGRADAAAPRLLVRVRRLQGQVKRHLTRWRVS